MSFFPPISAPRLPRTVRRAGRLAAVALAVAVPASLAIGAIDGSAAFAGQTYSQTFSFNDTTQYFTVPAGVTSLSFAVAGGDGGSGNTSYVAPGATAGTRGYGATVFGNISVTPGDTLVVEVGGAGSDASGYSAGGGGLSSGDSMNGGSGGYSTYGGLGGGGGGGTELVDATAGDTVIAVASGGGGGGGAGAAAADLLSGGNGGSAGLPGANGGGGASGGAGDAANAPGGGNGSNAEFGALAGGAGGGGGGFYAPQYGDFGGGNGGAGGGWETYGDGGGGGGSGASYASPAASGITFGQNYAQTDGYVTLSWLEPAPTTTTLTSSESTVTTGESYTLTATVAGTGTPAGTVTFTNSLGARVTGALNAGAPDEATISVTAPTTAEPVTWQAQYGGDAGDYASVSGLVVETVLSPTTTTVSVAGKVTAGSAETVKAVVTSASGNGVATGTVAFFRNGIAVGDVELAGGTAMLSVTAPSAAGTITWKALYLGDGTHESSLSTLVNQTVVAAAPSVTTIRPTSGPVGTKVTITGANLTGATEALWGTTTSTIACTSSTSCTAVAPNHGAATVSVRIVGPGGESAQSTAAEFTYTN